MRYTFYDPKKKKYHELDMTYDELQEYIKKNPTFEQHFNVTLGDPMKLGVKKSSSDFQKYVIGRMADSIPGNTIRKNAKIKIPKEI